MQSPLVFAKILMCGSSLGDNTLLMAEDIRKRPVWFELSDREADRSQQQETTVTICCQSRGKGVAT